jgi:hypothetical protein
VRNALHATDQQKSENTAQQREAPTTINRHGAERNEFYAVGNGPSFGHDPGRHFMRRNLRPGPGSDLQLLKIPRNQFWPQFWAESSGRFTGYFNFKAVVIPKKEFKFAARREHPSHL